MRRLVVLAIVLVLAVGCVPYGVVTGSVAQQARADCSNVLIVANGQAYPVAADGSFALQLPPGVYEVWATSDSHLSARAVVNVVAGLTVDLGQTILLGGDVNNDEVVNSTDHLIVLTAMESCPALMCPPDPLWPGADINGDGFVDATDWLIVLTNQDVAGPTVW